jgi:hypothetical protein
MIQPLLVSCPDLIKTFEPFHQGEKAEVEYLIDVWLACAPEVNIAQKAILDKLPYEGYDPRTDNISRRWVFGKTLFKWIKYISNKRGFPFEDFQIEAMLNGEANYGITGIN